MLAIVASNCNSKCTLHTELKKENTKGKGRHGKKKTQSSKRNLLMHAIIHTSTYEDERSRKKEIYIYIYIYRHNGCMELKDNTDTGDIT